MNSRIIRSIDEPVRGELSWNEKWKGPDLGLIFCWEKGREFRLTRPEVAEAANRGELPVMEWQGGVDTKLKSNAPKLGRLEYLATWQGMRSEDLDIDTAEAVYVTCSKFDQVVQFGPVKEII